MEKRRWRTTSTSVIKDNEVGKLSPPSLADLFRNIPGIRVEGGAGEGLNSYTVRGLPLVNGGAKYVQIQEDGLPVPTPTAIAEYVEA